MKKCLVMFFMSVVLSSATVLGADKPGELSGGYRVFDIVISYYGEPDGDNGGNTQDPANPSTQGKMRVDTVR